MSGVDPRVEKARRILGEAFWLEWGVPGFDVQELTGRIRQAMDVLSADAVSGGEDRPEDRVAFAHEWDHPGVLTDVRGSGVGEDREGFTVTGDELDLCLDRAERAEVERDRLREALAQEQRENDELSDEIAGLRAALAGSVSDKDRPAKFSELRSYPGMTGHPVSDKDRSHLAAIDMIDEVRPLMSLNCETGDVRPASCLACEPALRHLEVERDRLREDLEYERHKFWTLAEHHRKMWETANAVVVAYDREDSARSDPDTDDFMGAIQDSHVAMANLRRALASSVSDKDRS